MAFTSRCAALPLCAALFLSVAVTAASAQPEQCAQLVALETQYRGVTLTPAQKALKAQLLSWYRENCGRRNRIANN